jgi:hypothetical protein
LTYSFSYATIDISAWDSQAFLMVNFLPSLVKLHFPNFTLKLKLGVLLLCSTFLLDYQPTLAFPPVKRNVVFAEIVQEQSISIETSPVIFQLPHPGYITTRFSTYHPGIDLCSGLGMPIKPVTKGTVVNAGYNFFGLGLVVEVEHEGGYRSLYAHMGKIYVNQGQFVDSSNYIGEIGMTGHTSGPHTHLEITKDGKKIDPLLILPEIRNYPSEEDNAVPQTNMPSTVSIPVSSQSAQLTVPAASPVVKQIEAVIEKAVESKPEIDLPKQNVQNILNTASPKPSIAPVPEGGRLSLKNLSWFGFGK